MWMSNKMHNPTADQSGCNEPQWWCRETAHIALVYEYGFATELMQLNHSDSLTVDSFHLDVPSILKVSQNLT